MSSLTSISSVPKPPHWLRWPVDFSSETNRWLVGLLLVSGLLGGLISHELWPAVVIVVLLGLALLMPVQLSLGMFAFLIPFDSIATVGGSGPTLNWFAGAAAGAILLFKAMASRRWQAPPRAALWWGLLVLWSVLSSIWALDRSFTLQRAPTAISLFALYLVAVCFRIKAGELRAVAWMAITGAVVAALTQYSSYSAAASGRATLGTTDPNFFAASMLIPVALAISFSLSEPRRLFRLAAYAVIPVLTLAVFLTMSRGGTLALVGLAAVFLIRMRKWRLLFVIAAIAAPVLLVPDLFFQRLQQGAASRAAGRFDIWWVGWAIVKNHPLVGVGMENFSVAYRHYAGLADVFRGYDRVAHNTFISVFAEMGLVGLALLLAACGSQLRDAIRAVRNSTGQARGALVAYEAACWGLLTAACSLDYLWRKAFWLSWILLALAVRLYGSDEQRDAQSVVRPIAADRAHSDRAQAKGV